MRVWCTRSLQKSCSLLQSSSERRRSKDTYMLTTNFFVVFFWFVVIVVVVQINAIVLVTACPHELQIKLSTVYRVCVC